eukprot:gene3182-3218_t
MVPHPAGDRCTGHRQAQDQDWTRCSVARECQSTPGAERREYGGVLPHSKHVTILWLPNSSFVSGKNAAPQHPTAAGNSKPKREGPNPHSNSSRLLGTDAPLAQTKLTLRDAPDVL